MALLLRPLGRARPEGRTDYRHTGIDRKRRVRPVKHLSEQEPTTQAKGDRLADWPARHLDRRGRAALVAYFANRPLYVERVAVFFAPHLRLNVNSHLRQIEEQEVS